MLFRFSISFFSLLSFPSNFQGIRDFLSSLFFLFFFLLRCVSLSLSPSPSPSPSPSLSLSSSSSFHPSILFLLLPSFLLIIPPSMIPLKHLPDPHTLPLNSPPPLTSTQHNTHVSTTERRWRATYCFPPPFIPTVWSSLSLSRR